jgi:hypothetical protein
VAASVTPAGFGGDKEAFFFEKKNQKTFLSCAGAC